MIFFKALGQVKPGERKSRIGIKCIHAKIRGYKASSFFNCTNMSAISRIQLPKEGWAGKSLSGLKHSRGTLGGRVKGSPTSAAGSKGQLADESHGSASVAQSVVASVIESRERTSSWLSSSCACVVLPSLVCWSLAPAAEEVVHFGKCESFLFMWQTKEQFLLLGLKLTKNSPIVHARLFLVDTVDLPRDVHERGRGRAQYARYLHRRSAPQ